MLLNIIIFILSLIPAILIIIRLINRRKGDSLYKACSLSALKRGLFSVLPILALSGGLYVLGIIFKTTLLKDTNILIYKAIYTFIVLAFAEEIIKYAMFRAVLKKKPYPYTWADITAMIMIIGAAFGLVEDLPYAIGADAMMMVLRGFTLGHIGYAFVMGWFHAKYLYSGKKVFGVLAVVLPFLLHGLYDFSLTPELLEINDNFAFLGVSLALFDIVLLILAFRFFRRAKKQEKYQTPLASCPAAATLQEQPAPAEPTAQEQPPME